MCERCEGFTRREVLKGVVLGAGAVALAACGMGEHKWAAEDLPEVYEDHLMTGEAAGPGGAGAGAGGAVKVDLKKIVVPPPVAVEKTDVGEIMPRGAWTRLPLKLKEGVAMEGVEKVTIHHSGDGKIFPEGSVADVAKHLQIVQQAHLQRGMIDIAYHFAIDRSGRAWQLRWLAYEGQHVRLGKNGVRNNAHNVGIVVLGDFNLQAPSAAQAERLFAMVKLVRGKYGLGAGAVFMHGELVETDCPGKGLRPLVADARRRGVV